MKKEMGTIVITQYLVTFHNTKQGRTGASCSLNLNLNLTFTELLMHRGHCALLIWVHRSCRAAQWTTVGECVRTVLLPRVNVTAPAWIWSRALLGNHRGPSDFFWKNKGQMKVLAENLVSAGFETTFQGHKNNQILTCCFIWVVCLRH